jgi:small basic protein
MTLTNAATIAAILSGVVIPFLVDLITRADVSPRIKAAIATGLAALAGVIPTVVYDPNTGWQRYVANIAVAFLMTFTVHQTGVTDSVQRKTATKGVKPRANRPRTATHKHSRSAKTTTTTPTDGGAF